MSWTWGAPVPLSAEAGETGERAVLEAMSRIGRPAAIVAADGRVVYANAEAQPLLNGSVNGHLRAATPPINRRSTARSRP